MCWYQLLQEDPVLDPSGTVPAVPLKQRCSSAGTLLWRRRLCIRGEQDWKVDGTCRNVAAGAELKCQNPALSAVGKGGIELEGKLQDSSPFAEVLHEAQQE